MVLSLAKLLRPATAGVAIVLVAACGGTDFEKTSPPSSTTTTTIESAETKAWVEAGVQSFMNDPSAPLSRADATCLSRAFVHTVTVARFKAAGATIEDISDPNTNVPSGLKASVPPALQLVLGKALQACGFGKLIGSVFTDSIAEGISGGYRTSIKENDCVAAWFDSPLRRQLVADMFLSPEPSAADSRSIARLVGECLDFAAMMSPEFGFVLSDTERNCINTMARSDEKFRNALADEIQGNGGDSTGSFQIFGARIVKCLTPEHILALGRANNVPRPG